MEEEHKLTKRERRELAKEQKRQNKEQTRLASKLKKFAIWLVTGGIVLFIGFKAWGIVSNPKPEVAGNSVEVSQTDWVKGDTEGATTLIEYGDFQCPACANYYPLLKKLLEEIPEGLKIVYRHYPLTQIHKNAIPSAKAAEAAGDQGKFWEMHDILYEKQKDWEESGNSKEKFVEYARQLGLDENKFLEDFDSSKIEEKINSDTASGNRLKVNATPAFFLNGTKVQPKGYEEFKELVEDQIRGYKLE